jgi:hypothetical protein
MNYRQAVPHRIEAGGKPSLAAMKARAFGLLFVVLLKRDAGLIARRPISTDAPGEVSAARFVGPCFS